MTFPHHHSVGREEQRWNRPQEVVYDVLAAAPQPRWWRLTNPDAVHIEIAHVDPSEWCLTRGRATDPVDQVPHHVMRVSRVEESRVPNSRMVRRTVVTDEVELVPTRLGDVAQPSIAEFAQGALFVHMMEAPQVGEWVPVSEDDVLTAVASDGTRGAGSWIVPTGGGGDDG